MVTEAWGHAREGVVTLWRRVRPRDAESAGRELDEARAELLQAREDGTEAEISRELATEWQRRLVRALRDNAEAADALQRLLDEARGHAPEEAGQGNVRLEATASGNARIVQAERDVRIQGP